jgi:hypothetical protein
MKIASKSRFSDGKISTLSFRLLSSSARAFFSEKSQSAQGRLPQKTFLSAFVVNEKKKM